MEREYKTIFEGQKVQITDGAHSGKTGTFIKIIEFYDDAKKNALCTIDFGQERIEIREENFRFVEKHIQKAWESGDIEVE